MFYNFISTLFAFLFGFSVSCQVSFNGSAEQLDNGCFQITEAINTQNGSVWFEEEINLNEDLDLNLVMFFGNNDAGADGMAFVLQNNNLDIQGIGGGGVGYLNIPNSVAVEFDTWQNAELGDPDEDHIGISSNGANTHNLAGPVQASAGSTNIEDGQDHDVRIKWTASSNLLEVYFDCELRLTATQDIVNSSFGGDSLVYWGFVGSTGGASNLQTVCFNSGVGVPVNFTTCTGAPAELFVGDIDTTETVLWSPPDFLDATDIATPTSSATENFTYTVEYTHTCGYQASSEVSVVIEELEVTPLNTPVISCDEDLVLIQAESNYEDINVVWSTENGNISNDNGLNAVADTVGQYTVEVSYLDLCFAEYTFDIVIDPFGIDVDFEEPLELDCFNDQVVLDASVSSLGVTFEWTSEDGTFVSGTDTYMPSVDSPGTYVLNVELDENCMGTGEVEVIQGEGLVLENIGEYLITCDFTNTQLEVFSNFPDMDFSWDDTDGNIFLNDDTLMPSVSEGGDYILTGSIGMCEEELVVTVEEDTEVYEPFLVMITEPDCTTQGIVVVDFEVPVNEVIENGTWDWSTADGEILNTSSPWAITVGSGGTYNLTVENNANGCESELDINVTEVSSFELNVPDMVLLTCEEPTAVITAQVEGSPSSYLFNWDNGIGVIEANGLFQYSWDETGTVDLTVTLGNCVESSQIVIELSPSYGLDLSSIDAPNIFTPNQDVSNKSFYPVLKNDLSFDVVSVLENYELSIYSRWGTKIFTTTSGGWDGTINGEEAEFGVYYYVITFDSVCGDSANGELTGTVTLTK